ncbi:hypothetical protein [Shewanella fodinae]|uniref:DUF2946 family protein n=1 Tax=Shewanella fodinae TaxID=552357 RepID=A0A4R2FES9_9GAMM|nr:hypothetical protein [Shewanella fodinae]TCN86332.1 hypothetical protein EDC91_10782 [Shewanella fodinae]
MIVTGRLLSWCMALLLMLQFAVSDVGTHQLHAGNSYEETLQHTHLQITQPIVAVADCERHDGEPLAAEKSALHHLPHQELQQLDLCLDCPCHGGHISLPMQPLFAHALLVSHSVIAEMTRYLPIASEPAYRPPIAVTV